MTPRFTPHSERHGPQPDALLAFSFRERPFWKIGFGHHVRQWDRHMRRQVWARFHTDPEFAAAYQAEVERRMRPSTRTQTGVSDNG